MNQLLTQALVICMCLFALTGQAMTDSLAEAKSAYDEGDFEKSAKLLINLTEQGNDVAQARLGYLYKEGQGVQKNLKKAYKLIRLSVAQGNAEAQFTLGRMYEEGEGVPQDINEAIQWYRLSATQGNAVAQRSLGARYLFGLSVIQDFNEALMLLRLASEQGDVMAQFAYGGMYAQGQGVPKNFVKAHMWVNICTANTHDSDFLQLCIKLRDSLAVRMTSVQIAEAQQLAKECTANKFKGC